jgi:hypothetical protein
LGVEFLDEVERSYEQISQNLYPYRLSQGLRMAFMYRFPYKMVFDVEEQAILVYAVYHDKRDPEKLAERE